MNDVTLSVKSRRPDLVRAHRLLDSIPEHNRDRIGVFISIPVDDLVAFQDLSRRFTDFSALADDHFGVPRIDRKIWGFAPGYITRQLVKLSVRCLSGAGNFLILDSDPYFIRGFATKIFIAPGGTGPIVLAKDKMLVADPAYAGLR